MITDLHKFLFNKNKHSLPKFVIIGAMRSGSNLFQEKLNYFDDLICLGELFNRSFVGVNRPNIYRTSYGNFERDGKGLVKVRNRDPLKFLGEMVDTARAENKMLGFRIFNQHNKRVLSLLLNSPAVKKVILHRGLIDSFISLRVAQNSGRWLNRGSKDILVNQTEFRLKDFRKYVAQNQKFYKSVKSRLDSSGQPYKIVSYEDILQNEKVQAVGEFVGSRAVMKQRETILKKVIKGGPETSLSNYAEVKGFLNQFNQNCFGLEH
jgi:hypothetical protein